MFDAFTPYVLMDLAEKGGLLIVWTLAVACVVALADKALSSSSRQ